MVVVVRWAPGSENEQMPDSAYDPDKWDEEFKAVIRPYAGRRLSADESKALGDATRDLHARRRAAARAAFPWVDLWYDESHGTEFRDAIEARMSDEDARLIRHARVDDGYTWRSVAQLAYDRLRQRWRVGWTMPAHQEVGRSICVVAARRLNEDAESDPWN